MVFILASASPRRLELLKQIGRVPDLTQPADVDERPEPGERPQKTAERLAILKASAIAAESLNDIVLGADTVVACGNRQLPKPDDQSQATKFLTLLSGRRHRVYGGIAIASPQGMWHRVVMTQVTFKRLTDAEISHYVESGEWQGKAGGYGIQGRAGAFVKRINGSYSNVVGLCLNTVESVLAHHLGPASHDAN